MAAFAFISHFAFCFGFGIPFDLTKSGLFNKTSVLFSLAMSILLISIFNNKKIADVIKIFCVILFCILIFGADWSSIAMMMPFFLYQHRNNKKQQVIDYIVWIGVYSAVYIIFIDKLYGFLQFATLLSIPLLMRYDNTRGKGRMWFFYYYYPLHLIIIGILRIIMYGDIPLVFQVDFI